MNRIDELTDRLIDATLTDAEAEQLTALTGTEPAALGRHFALLNLEATLRGLRTDLDFSADVLNRIEVQRTERTADAVMSEIAQRPTPAWGRRRSPWRRVAVAVTAMAAALLLGIWLIRATPPRDSGLARVRTISGSVEIVGPSGTDATDTDRPLREGQTVRTVGADSVAVLEFPDRTRLELNPDTELRLTSLGSEGSPRSLYLVQGQLTASVTGRQTVLGTGGGDVIARNGSYTVWASGPESVRVESTAGDVQLVRGHQQPSPLALAPGRAAFVRDEFTPVRLETLSRTDTSPRATLDFTGALDVAFAADGKAVLAVSAKQRIRWRTDVEQRTTERLLFEPPVKNDGPVGLLSADGRSVIACRVDDREERLFVFDSQTGTVRRTFPIRVTEPRFLCASPDAAWVATVSGKPEKTLRVWDTATGRERFRRDLEENPGCLASTTDGRQIAYDVANFRRSTDNRVQFLDAVTGAPTFSLPTRRRTVTALAFTADGKFLAAGFNGAVQLWDVTNRRLVSTLEGFERVVTRLAYSPSGDLVAAGTQDGQVWVWATDTGRRVQVLGTGTRGVRALSFSPDGKQIVTATSKGPVALWNVAPIPANDPDRDL